MSARVWAGRREAGSSRNQISGSTPRAAPGGAFGRHRARPSPPPGLRPRRPGRAPGRSSPGPARSARAPSLRPAPASPRALARSSARSVRSARSVGLLESLDISYIVLLACSYAVPRQRTRYEMNQDIQTSHAVVAEGLGKRYGDQWALRDFDLAVPTGSVLGLLGHNGAGKTTAIRILTTLAAPTEGSAKVAGHDVVADPNGVRDQIGLTSQAATVDGLMSGFANLEMIGRLYHLPRKVARARATGAARRAAARGRRRPPGQGVQRRHAPPARSRRQPRRLSPGPLPRRADHRPRPGKPQRALGPAAPAGRRRHHADPHHPVPGGGRHARRRRRPARPRQDRRHRLAGAAEGAPRRRTRRRHRRRRRRPRRRPRRRSRRSPRAPPRSTARASSSPPRRAKRRG